MRASTFKDRVPSFYPTAGVPQTCVEVAGPCLRIRRGVVGVDAGQTLSISRHAPDWCVQCFGIELVAVRLIVLLNFIWGLRIQSRLWEAAKPPTH